MMGMLQDLPMAESKRAISIPRHESRDVGERFIYFAVGVMLALLIICALGTLWLYPQSRLDHTLTLPLPVFPKPALQTNPAADMSLYYAREMQTLETGGRIDGKARMPIEEAMRQTVRDGIPGWPN
jgi:hypothetical protein